MDLHQIEELAALIRMEYLEMPDLKLTLRQAGRLWDAPVDRAEAAMRALVANVFLAQTKDGSFLRRQYAPPEIESLVRAS